MASSLSHRLTMLADVWRPEDPGGELSGFGGDTQTEQPALTDLACFVTVENIQRQRRATIEFDTGITHYIMLVEQGTDIKLQDRVQNVRRADGTAYFDEGCEADVVAVMPHQGFGPHTTNLTECHLRLIGG